VVIWDICGHLGHFVVIWEFCGHLGHFVVVWDILWSFGTFCGHLGHFVVIWEFCGHLGHFVVVWDILWSFGTFCGYLVYFSRFGMLYREKSGNPDRRRRSIGDVIGRRLKGRRFGYPGFSCRSTPRSKTVARHRYKKSFSV
jgi:hypothetical protein